MDDGPVIDCDGHHDWPTQEHLPPYLSQSWQDYVVESSRTGGCSEVSGKGLESRSKMFFENAARFYKRGELLEPDRGRAPLVSASSPLQ